MVEAMVNAKVDAKVDAVVDAVVVEEPPSYGICLPKSAVVYIGPF